MQPEVLVRAPFEEFVENNERGLRHALVSYFGSDLGRDSAAQALLYGLENWERVSCMENPAGYLYRVGQRWGRRQRRVVPTPREAPSTRQDPWFEPGLTPALKNLSVKQRVAVVLRHGLDMTYGDIARLTDSSQSAVRKNVQRALAELRKALEVDDE